MELILQVKVLIGEQFFVSGKKADINMVDFTGEAYGKYFNGKVVGAGVDTQKVENKQLVSLSARYMLEGIDYTNAKCRIFIENNGKDMEHCVPYFVTDSEALSKFEKSKLKSVVTCIEGGVLVSVYDEDGQEPEA